MERLRDGYPELTSEQQALDLWYEKAQFYQQQLEASTGSKDEKVQFADDAVSELDSLYPYNGREVYIAGWALIPLADDEGAITSEGFADVGGIRGTHQGFNRISYMVDDEPQIKILHQVMINEQRSDPLATISHHQRIYHYYDLESRVFCMEDLEAIFATQPTNPEGNPLETANVFSHKFVELLRSTTFRRMTHKSQKRTVDDFMLGAEKASGIRGADIMASPEYAYAPVTRNGAQFFIPMDLTGELVKGTCVGLETLVTNELRYKSIRRNVDSMFWDEGLCVVVDPDEETRERLKLLPEQVLFIPTYSQDFEATLFG